MVKPAERIAFRDQLAKALAWLDITEDQRTTYGRKADRVLTELEAGYEQGMRTGWMWVPADAEEVDA